MFDGMGVAHACSTGRWAGNHAAQYATTAKEPVLYRDQIGRDQIDREKARIYAPVKRTDGIDWKEMAAGIAKVMQDYCGDTKTEELMNIGMIALKEIQEAEATHLTARNPHELMRALEVLDILTVSEMIITACQARKASNSWNFFDRMDYPDDDPPEWRKWVSIKLENHKVKIGELPLDYYGSLEDNYHAHKIM
jgi:succinate dehydrogenase/fumarate reductase flavoprotein subunit